MNVKSFKFPFERETFSVSFLTFSKGQGFKCLWIELWSWADWMVWWCNSESSGKDKHSRLLTILHFLNCFSIKLSSVSLKRSLQIYKSLQMCSSPISKPLPCHISYFFFLMFLRTLLLVFPVLFHRLSQNTGNLPYMTSYYNAIIYECVRILNQILISNRRKFVGGSQVLPTWNW